MKTELRLGDLVADAIDRRSDGLWPMRVSAVVKDIEPFARPLHIHSDHLRRMVISYALNIGINIEFD
jgi:hypothetical protein